MRWKKRRMSEEVRRKRGCEMEKGQGDEVEKEKDVGGGEKEERM